MATKRAQFLIISDHWLRKCGMLNLVGSGRVLPIVASRSMPYPGDVMHTVTLPNGREWLIWAPFDCYEIG